MVWIRRDGNRGAARNQGAIAQNRATQGLIGSPLGRRSGPGTGLRDGVLNMGTDRSGAGRAALHGAYTQGGVW